MAKEKATETKSKEELKLEKMFKNTFLENTESTEVLMHILNMLDYYETNSNNISVDKISVANEILSTIGYKSKFDLTNFMSGLMASR